MLFNKFFSIHLAIIKSIINQLLIFYNMKQLFTLLSLIFLGTQVSFSQSYFSENFESGAGAWTFYDNNGDGLNWMTVDASSLSSAFGSTSIWSHSYTNTAVTPDNLAISPAVNLVAATGNPVLQYQY